MNQLSRLLVVVAVAALLVAVGWGTGANCGTGPKDRGAGDDEGESRLLGKPAPDVRADAAVNGTPVGLADLKGKVVLLDFWAVWCGPCIATFPHLRDWNKEFRGQGLEVVGVTTYFQHYRFDRKQGKLVRVEAGEDNSKAAAGLTPAQEQDMLKAFARHHKLNYRLLVLTREDWRKATERYRIEGIPTMVLIDRTGVVRMVRVGAQEDNVEAIQGEIKRLLEQK